MSELGCRLFAELVNQTQWSYVRRLSTMHSIETLLAHFATGKEEACPPVSDVRSVLGQLKSSIKQLSSNVLHTITFRCCKIQELMFAHKYNQTTTTTTTKAKEKIKRSVSGDKVTSLGISMTIASFEESQLHYGQLLHIFAQIDAQLERMLSDEQAPLDVRQECQSHVRTMKSAVMAYENKLVLVVHEATMDINGHLYAYLHLVPEQSVDHNQRIVDRVQHILHSLIAPFATDHSLLSTTSTPATAKTRRMRRTTTTTTTMTPTEHGPMSYHTDDGNDDEDEAVTLKGRLACAWRDNSIHILSLPSGQCTLTLTGHIGYVHSLQWLPSDGNNNNNNNNNNKDDDDVLASGSRDHTVKLWHTRTGQCLRTLTGHTRAVVALALMDNRWRLASGSADTSVRVWSTRSGQCMRVLRGHTNMVVALASISASRLASGSWDRKLMLWDMTSGTCVHSLVHTNLVISLLAIDEGRVASGCWDGTLRLWNVTSGELVKLFAEADGGHFRVLSSMQLVRDGDEWMLVNQIAFCFVCPPPPTHTQLSFESGIFVCVLVCIFS